MIYEKEVHVWRAEANGANSAAFENHLSAEELARAAKFRFEKHRNAFTFARATLRQLLSRYCSVSPKQLQFQYNDYGKPFLNNSEIRFNLSHSGKVVLYAITIEREIGIDLESIDREVDFLSLAERFFSTDESKMLQSVPQPSLARTFFRCWTHKEAYIKARGMGLSLPLNSPVQPGWLVQDIDVGANHAAALAFEGDDCIIKHFQWNL